MRYVLNPDVDIEKMVAELNKLDGVNARVEEVDVNEYANDYVSIVIKSDAIRMELERILIFLEEQNETDLAIQRLHELDEIFEKIQQGVFDFEI